MISNKFEKKIPNLNFSKLLTLLFFTIFFVLGLNIYKDYGLSVDEPFQRSLGYYWYIYLIETFTNNQELLVTTQNKFEAMYWSQYLSQGNLLQYGIFFDTLAAFIEEILNIKDTQNAFYFKHFLTFCFFFISSIFFYKIVAERFGNKFYSIIFTFLYLSSPRIFAESFYNNKDIVFMALIVCSLYFALKNFTNLNYKNLFYFSLFSAFATNVRVMGILIFGLFLFFLFLDSLEEKKFLKKNITKIIFLIFSYLIILYVFWPFLWKSPLTNLIFTIKSFANFNWSGEGILYLGNYHRGSNLPWHYIPVWILATMPIILMLFFLVGLIKKSVNISKNILNLSEKNKLWKNTNEKKDFFVLLFFVTPIFLVILLNSTLYGGWRHLYFIYPCIIYLASIGMVFFLSDKIFLKYKKIFYILIMASVLINLYNLIRLHPYQNVYFNSLFEKKANKLFEIDYWGLGNASSLKFLAKNKFDGNKLEIKVSSYTPLSYSLLILDDNEKNLFLNMGTTNKNQKFLFTNYIFESNPNFEKKYSISNNYEKIYTLRRGNIIINEIFEKK